MDPANFSNFLRARRGTALSLIYLFIIAGNFLLVPPKSGKINVIFGNGRGAQIEHHPDISHFQLTRRPKRTFLNNFTRLNCLSGKLLGHEISDQCTKIWDRLT